MAFLMVDFELFEKYPELSDGARILYSFICYKMRFPLYDANGQAYINFHGDCDPRRLLKITKKQLLKRMKELTGAGLVVVDGMTWQQKIYIVSDQMGTNEAEPAPKSNQVSAQKVTKLEPKGHQVSAQKVTNSLNINIEKYNSINTKSSSNNTTYNCPSLEEVKAEAVKNGYTSDPEKFFYYNEVREWKSVSNWRAAFKLWELREHEHASARNRANVASITGAAAGLLIDMPETEPCPVTITADNIATDNIIDIFEGLIQ